MILMNHMESRSLLSDPPPFIRIVRRPVGKRERRIQVFSKKALFYFIVFYGGGAKTPKKHIFH